MIPKTSALEDIDQDPDSGYLLITDSSDLELWQLIAVATTHQSFSRLIVAKLPQLPQGECHNATTANY